MKKLTTLNIKGVDYELVDDLARNEITQHVAMISGLKQGISELAVNIKQLKANDIPNKTTLLVEDVHSFPILKFDGEFSILVDITLVGNNEIYSSQQLIKWMLNDNIYHKTIDENYMIQCYYLLGKKNDCYIFFDTPLDSYNLMINTVSYSGNTPKYLIDEEKFSLNKYSLAKRLK